MRSGQKYYLEHADRVLARVFADLPPGASDAEVRAAIEREAGAFAGEPEAVKAWLARVYAWSQARREGRPRPMDQDTTRRLRKGERAASAQQDLF